MAPAYPFGSGVGYTTWSYDAVRVAQGGDGHGAAGSVTVRVDVTNTGSRTGREVVQVYLERPGSAVERPVRWLAGSAVVTAAAGQQATAEVTVRRRAFEHWDTATGGWAAEPGTFVLVVGRHADSTELTAEVDRA